MKREVQLRGQLTVWECQRCWAHAHVFGDAEVRVVCVDCEREESERAETKRAAEKGRGDDN
jgi:ribosomal protein S27E